MGDSVEISVSRQSIPCRRATLCVWIDSHTVVDLIHVVCADANNYARELMLMTLVHLLVSDREFSPSPTILRFASAPTRAYSDVPTASVVVSSVLDLVSICSYSVVSSGLD